MFRLSSQFIEQYKDKQPEWGYGPFSYVIYKRSYARPLDPENPTGPTEEYWQTCQRVVEGTFELQKRHVRLMGAEWNYAKSQATAQRMFQYMWEFKFLPPGRGLWAMGSPLIMERGNGAALFNCGFVDTSTLAVDFADPFCFLFEASAHGVGVGFNTAGEGKVTIVTPKQGKDVFVVEDSREGWSALLKRVLDAYVDKGSLPAQIDYSKVRPAGAPIKSFGGTASGPEALKELIEHDIPEILKTTGKITSTQIVDVMNVIGKCVVAGGARRSSEIALGSIKDKDFRDLKLDKEKLEAYRWNSNNSVIVPPFYHGFDEFVDPIMQRGEPGFFFLENAQNYSRMNGEPDFLDKRVKGLNPCFSGDARLATVEGDIPFKELDGREVEIFNGLEQGKTALGRVWKSGTKETITVIFEDGIALRCTPDHVFRLTDGTDCEARHLVGKEVRTIPGRQGRVVEVQLGLLEDVYDFTQPDSHYGIVEGCVVHNCGEQTLEDRELCNIPETMPARCSSLEEYLQVLKIAYLYGKTVTLTNTPWAKANAVMLRNRRIGVSMTGITQNIAKRGVAEHIRWCEEGYNYIQELDVKYSEWLCVRESLKTTTVKPSGTVSILSGSTPGIHYPHAEYYLRRARFNKHSPLLENLRKSGYPVEQDVYDKQSFVVSFPIHEQDFFRGKEDVTIWEQMLNAALMQRYWSDNSVSITVDVKPDEAQYIPTVLDYYQFSLKAVSFLPSDAKGYEQPPYETITKEKYEELMKGITEVDLSAAVHEVTDKFCDGDSCQI